MAPAKIAVIYSSTYGHVRTLAEKIAEGVRETGATVDTFQFPEILSPEVLAKMHAAPKADYPIIKPEQLTEYDGFLFGIPTRYGRAVASASAFFDATGGLWMRGALVGKMAGIFTSTGSQHGGQETTALTTLPVLAHHGILFVPTGFAAPQLSDNSTIIGGSAYGAGTVAGSDGSRQPNEQELAIALHQGKSFAGIVNQYVPGKAVLERSNQTVAAKALPAVAAAEATPAPAAATEAKPYAVDNQAAQTTSAPTPAPAAAPATPAVSAATANHTAAKPKKKGGLFSCCGNSNNYDS